MSLKRINKLNEGPMDFMRGASSAAGQQMAKSKLGQAVGDINRAGQAASLTGDLDKAVKAFSVAYVRYLQINKQPAAQQPAAQQPAAQQPASPFARQGKPTMRPGKYGHEYKFEQHLQDAFALTPIEEGPVDFIKGVGNEIKNKAINSVRDYAANTKSVLRDVVQAGVKAHEDGAAKAAATKAANELTNVKQQALTQLQQIVTILKKLGPNASKAVQAAVSKHSGANAQRILNVISNNAKKAGIQL